MTTSRSLLVTICVLGALLTSCAAPVEPKAPGQPESTVAVPAGPTASPQPTTEPPPAQVTPTQPPVPSPRPESLQPQPTVRAIAVPPDDQADYNLLDPEHGGAVVSVTDELAQHPAERLIDGYKLDGGEWWTHEPPAVPQAVVFELAQGAPYVIDRAVVNAWTSEWRYAWVKDFQLFASEVSPDPDQMAFLGAYRLKHVGVDQTFTFDPISARYVALVVRSHYGGAEGVTLNEFEVYAAPPGTRPAQRTGPADAGNLTAADNGGEIVAFSSEDPNGDWSASRLIDGRDDTPEGWSSEQELGDQYVVFGLRGGWTHVVDRVVLNPYSDGYEDDWIREFELRGSETETEPGKMEPIGRFRLDQVGEDQTFSFAPTPARYLALIPLSNYGGSAYGLNEFAVYGAGAGTIAPEVMESQPVQRSAEVEASKTIEVPSRLPPATDAPVTGPAAHQITAGAGSPLDRVDVDVTIHDLVPVIYHLYGPYMEDLAQTTLTNRNPEPIKVRVATTVDSYTETDIKTVTLESGETITVKQSPPLIPGALEGLHEMRQASLHVVVDYLKEGERRLIYEDTSPITVYSRDDFPWNIPGYYNGTQFLATMVTPNDPAVEELLRRAADRVPGGIMTFGYGQKDDGDHQTWDRVKAIYEALAEDYDLIYVASGVSFVPQKQMAEGFSLQRLQLPYEVMAQHGGMCVELSTLFASALEKILLRPIIVTIPGHVYVGLPISWDSHTYYFVEATLVGRASFEEAVEIGNRQFMEEHLGLIDEDRLDYYFWLDVSEARAEGILPVPWR